MTVVRVLWWNPLGEVTTLLRDPYEQGRFLCGVECNEWGVGIREGCTEEPKLMIRRDRIRSMEPIKVKTRDDDATTAG